MNSRAEFNRCYIPRLVVELEDESMIKKRMEQELKDQEEINEILDGMELNWEERKAKEKELLEKKRRRDSEMDGGGKVKKRRRRMTHAILEENWGEDDEQQGEQITNGVKRPREEECERGADRSNMYGGCTKKQRFGTRRTKSTSITEYFKSTVKQTFQKGQF